MRHVQGSEGGQVGESVAVEDVDFVGAKVQRGEGGELGKYEGGQGWDPVSVEVEFLEVV